MTEGFGTRSEKPQTAFLIDLWKGGELSGRDRLIERIYPDLRAIAAAQLRREGGSSLSTGDIINDVVLKLIRLNRIDIADRTHLVALASRMMRNILVDQARLRHSDKRRHEKIELNTRIDGNRRVDLKSLDSALIRLGAIDPGLMDLVEMRYFGGMTVADIAQVMPQSETMVKRRWAIARAWLTDALLNPIDHD